MLGLAVLLMALAVQQVWIAVNRGPMLAALACGIATGSGFVVYAWHTRRPGRSKEPLSTRQSASIAVGAGLGGTLLSIGPDWAPVMVCGFSVVALLGLGAALWFEPGRKAAGRVK